MSENITVECSDTLGKYLVKKRRGKFTLDEILDALRKYDGDIYYIVFDAREDTYQGWDDTPQKGDVVEAYKLFALQTALLGRD
jgi:hypothetical protein